MVNRTAAVNGQSDRGGQWSIGPLGEKIQGHAGKTNGQEDQG